VSTHAFRHTALTAGLIAAAAVPALAQRSNPHRLSGSEYRKLKDRIYALEAEEDRFEPDATGLEGNWRLTGTRTYTDEGERVVDEIAGEFHVYYDERYDEAWEAEGKVKAGRGSVFEVDDGVVEDDVLRGELDKDSAIHTLPGNPDRPGAIEMTVNEDGTLSVTFTSDRTGPDGSPLVRGSGRAVRAWDLSLEEIEAELFALYTKQRQHRYDRPGPVRFATPADAVSARFAPTVRHDPDGIERMLVGMVEEARESIDLCLFEFELMDVARALVRAKERGVRVRMVTDTEELEMEAVRHLDHAGIGVVGDGRTSLMHNKFIVFDGERIWTGSTNVTPSGIYLQDNNALTFRSEALARVYTTEFEEMFVDAQFGPTSAPNTPWSGWQEARADGDDDPTERWLEVGADTEVQVYFAPEDEPMARLVEVVRSARKSIKFLAFAYTSEPLIDVMVERMRSEDRVTIEGVFEARHAGWSSIAIGPLHNAGLETAAAEGEPSRVTVRFDDNPFPVHHKVIIIDDEIVCTGSFNFSDAADRTNDENLLIVRNPALARAFAAEFANIMSTTDPTDPRIGVSGMPEGFTPLDLTTASADAAGVAARVDAALGD